MSMKENEKKKINIYIYIIIIRANSIKKSLYIIITIQSLVFFISFTTIISKYETKNIT